MHGKPCECVGTQAPWPWIIHRPWAGGRFCDCHLAFRSSKQMRPWVRRDCDPGPASGQELLERIDRIAYVRNWT